MSKINELKELCNEVAPVEEATMGQAMKFKSGTKYDGSIVILQDIMFKLFNS